MKDFKLEVVRKAMERLIVRVTATHEDGTTSSREVNMSGNCGSVPLWGATLAVDALNEMQKEYAAKPGDPDYSEPCPTCGG